MAPRSGKAVAKGTSKNTSKTSGDQTRRTSRVRKSTSKASLHTGSGASSQHPSRNVSRRRRSPPPRPSPPRSPSPPSGDREEDEEEEEEEDTAPADAQLAALRLRAKVVAKEISIQKQRKAARDALTAQELQLQNLTVDDTRTFAPQPPIGGALAFPIAEDRNSFVGVMPNYTAVATMFPNIPRRYLDDIFHGRLDVKNIVRFIVDFSSMAASEKVDAPEAKSMNDLIRSFDLYAYIVWSFTPQQSVKNELHRVITLYRLRLMSMVGYKTFASIKLYHEEFLARVIRLGQDNPLYWTMAFPEAEWRLVDVPKKSFEPSSLPAARKPYGPIGSAKEPLAPAPGERWTVHNGACRQWARSGDCSKGPDCKYRHMCLPCQEDHNPNRCPSRR